MNSLLRKLDLTSLRLFIAVCQESSIARAAEREFIAPSAVSRRLADMEALVGLPLVERHARGVRPTVAGETVLHYAHQIISHVEGLGAALSRLHTGTRGQVQVAANLSAIVQFLPEDIAAFQRVFPEVDIDLDEQHSPDVLRLVRERAVDFGICNRTAAAQDLEQLPYRHDRLAVMLPAAHPKASAGILSLQDLAGEIFVGLRENSALTQQLAEQARLLGVALSVRMRVASLDALCRMAHAGLGIAVVPQRIAEMYLHSLDVSVCPLSDPWAQREICILYLGEGQLSATADTLVRFLARQS